MYRRHADRILIQTPAQERPFSLSISLSLDDSEESILPQTFQYKEDPTISIVEPTEAILRYFHFPFAQNKASPMLNCPIQRPMKSVRVGR